MALDKNGLLALIANLFPDNTNEEITPARLRQGLEEMVSSDLNLEELTEQLVKGALTQILLAAANPDPTHQEGMVFYDSTEKALSYYNEESDTKINCGQEVVIKVLNNSGGLISNGEVVRFDTSVAGVPTVVKSFADTLENSVSSGIATHDIANGQTGYITRTGKLSGIDTSTWAEGDALYVSDVTPGALTNVSPPISSPVAVVLTMALNGQIYTSTSRLREPVAIGQERSPAPPGPFVSQGVTTTPAPVEGFDNSPFVVNTTINNIASGTGFRAQFSPASNPFSGFYNLFGSAAMTSTDNVVVFLEVYINGSPTGLISVLDFSNPSIDFGSVTLASFTEVQIGPSDIIEAYIYCDTGTTTVTYQGLSFSIERIGVS